MAIKILYSLGLEMADFESYTYHKECNGPSIRVFSPEGRVLSPEVLKRVIEGHESTDTFDEGIDLSSVKHNESYDGASEGNSESLAKEIANFVRE